MNITETITNKDANKKILSDLTDKLIESGTNTAIGTAILSNCDRIASYLSDVSKDVNTTVIESIVFISGISFVLNAMAGSWRAYTNTKDYLGNPTEYSRKNWNKEYTTQ
jgi:hypothetical protein